MIKATFTHKDRYKTDDLHIDHTSVSFSGDPEMVEKLTELSKTVQFDKSRLSDFEIGFLAEDRMGKVAEINGVRSQIAELKRDKFLKLKRGNTYARYRELSDTLDSLVEEEQAILGDIEDLEDDRFYSRRELKDRFTRMLRNLSFVTRETTTNKNGVTIEYLETTIPDREVMMGVATATTLLEREMAEKKAKILERYRGVPVVENAGEMASND